jgi:hypothetical protein
MWIAPGVVVAIWVVMVTAIGVSHIILPLMRMYCTRGFETCITRSRYSPWRVVDRPCPPGQSLRFDRPAIYLGFNGCHAIEVPGFSAPLDVCPAACGK